MANEHTNIDNLRSTWQEKYRAKKLLQIASDPEFQLQQGDEFLAQNKLPEAIACYRRVLKLSPHHPKAHQQLALALKQQGELSAASLHYRQAIDQRSEQRESEVLGVSPMSNFRKKAPSFYGGVISDSQLAGERHKSSLAKQDERSIALIYLQQAQSFEMQQEWQKSITACQEALDFDPQLAPAYKTWADSLQKSGNLTEAMGYYAKALAIKPDFAEVCLNLGSLSFRQQQWQQAIDYYRQAIAIDSGCAEAYRNLARVYKKLNQRQLMLDYWFEALQLEPEQADAGEHCNLAQIMGETGHDERAIACYQQAVKLQPKNPQIYLGWGDLLISQGKDPQAVIVYRQGIKYFPRHGELNFRLAQLLERENNESAIVHYQQAIKTKPQDWKLYFCLGNFYAKRQEHHAAIDCYQQVLQLHPQYLAAYPKLAQMQLAVKQWLGAIRSCQQGLKLNPKQEQLYNYLGIALLEQQEYDAAVKVYLTYLKLNPEVIDSYRNLGVALMAEQRWSEAINCYQQLLKREPRCLEGYHNLGTAAAKAQEWKTSAIAWSKAIELQADEPWSYHHLGMAWINLEQWSKASEALEHSIEFNPDFPWSYFHLGDALGKQQRWQESSAAYRNFLIRETNAYAYERLGDNLIKQIKAFTPEAQLLQQEAQQCYYRAIEIEPDHLHPYYKLMELKPYDAQICYMLAETYARQSEWSTAIIFYQIGLGINPIPQAHFELALVLEQQQKLDDAITHYQLAVDLNPHEPQYRSHLTQAVSKQQELPIEC